MSIQHNPMEESKKEKKRVLVIYYTQTGQLRKLAEAVSAPLREDDAIEVVYQELKPVTPYPFPWRFMPFLDTMPCCVLEKGRDVLPVGTIIDESFDLIILAYQVWFLSPAPPVCSFLKSNDARKLLTDTPVVTLIGCRGMWVMAHEVVEQKLKDIRAKYIGNIAVSDQGNAVASLVTTPRWMFTGEKDGFWGIFPPAGIAKEDIAASARFGDVIRKAIKKNCIGELPKMLRESSAAPIDARLIASEKIGRKLFGFWAKIFEKTGPEGCFCRKMLIFAFLTVFFPLLIVFVPLRLALFALFDLLKGVRQQF